MKNLSINSRNYGKLFGSVPNSVKAILGKKYNSVLAGGSIRSLLEGNTPRDYDVYFLGNDPATGRQLAEDLLKKLHFKNVEPPSANVKVLVQGPVRIELIIPLPLAVINTAEELIQRFDFSVCQFATTDFTNVITTKKALQDLRERRLSLSGAELHAPSATLKRVIKYLSYGYKPTPDFFKSLSLQIKKAPQKALDREYV